MTLMVTATTQYASTSGERITPGTVVRWINGTTADRPSVQTWSVIGTGQTFTANKWADVREVHNGTRVLVIEHENGSGHVVSDSQTHPGGFGGVRDTFDATVRAVDLMPAVMWVEMWTVGSLRGGDVVAGPAWGEEHVTELL